MKQAKAEIHKLERKIEQIVDRIIESDNAALVTAYENRRRKLEESKVSLSEKISNYGRPLQSFKETFRIAFDFLSNPQKLWLSELFEDKRTVLKLVVPSSVPYHRNEDFRTAETKLPFKVLAAISTSEKVLVEPDGGGA